jgi:hypothetical protein
MLRTCEKNFTLSSTLVSPDHGLSYMCKLVPEVFDLIGVFFPIANFHLKKWTTIMLHCNFPLHVTICVAENSCKYKVGEWGPCDPASKKRTKLLTLVKGNTKKCKAVKEIQRLCSRPDGSGKYLIFIA